MPYNTEKEEFYQSAATIVDSTPDGDSVKQGFNDRLSPAMAEVYNDMNLLKSAGMIGVGVPATSSARGIGRVATAADITSASPVNGPAFIAAGTALVSATPGAGKIPVAGTNAKLAAGWLPLNNTVTSTSTAEVATAKAVKTAYDKAVGAASAAAVRAPVPQAAAGVGQWKYISSASSVFPIPSGGTWAYYFYAGYNGVVYQQYAGIAPGGTTLTPGFPTGGTSGLVWRIA